MARELSYSHSVNFENLKKAKGVQRIPLVLFVYLIQIKHVICSNLYDKRCLSQLVLLQRIDCQINHINTRINEYHLKDVFYSAFISDLYSSKLYSFLLQTKKISTPKQIYRLNWISRSSANEVARQNQVKIKKHKVFLTTNIMNSARTERQMSSHVNG